MTTDRANWIAPLRLPPMTATEEPSPKCHEQNRSDRQVKDFGSKPTAYERYISGRTLYRKNSRKRAARFVLDHPKRALSPEIGLREAAVEE